MEPNNPWTVASLLRAFLDLALTFILLCGSAFAFSVSKFLSMFKLFLPCPCRGILGFQNSNICWHKQLIDLPMRKIQHVKMLMWSRFPFDFVWHVMVQLYRIRRSGDEFRESEEEGGGEVCCSSRFSGPKSSRKKIMNQKDRSISRRRKRVAVDCGKRLSVLSCGNSPSAVCSQVRCASGESFGSNSVRDCDFHGELHIPDSVDMIDEYCGFDISKSSGDNEGMEIGSFVEGRHIFNSVDEMARGNEVGLIQKLKEALQKEKAAQAALYLELEEERAAAATAADQAMDMISRLQEEKSSLEMEARQYQRMIEARIAYEEEEMDILKEIVISRELEIHSLEKEVEAYKRPCNFDDQLEDDLSDGIEYQISKYPHQLDLAANKSITKGTVMEASNWSLYDKSMSDARQGTNFIPKTDQICTGETYSKDWDWSENVEQHKELSSNADIAMVDKDSTVYDVHVVDEKTGSDKKTSTEDL